MKVGIFVTNQNPLGTIVKTRDYVFTEYGKR
jgi:hypothetical protein